MACLYMFLKKRRSLFCRLNSGALCIPFQPRQASKPNLKRTRGSLIRPRRVTRLAALKCRHNFSDADGPGTEYVLQDLFPVF